jgi:hypothetical protein
VLGVLWPHLLIFALFSLLSAFSRAQTDDQLLR